METIELDKWYQLDWKITATPRNSMQSVANLVDLLKKKRLITHWFYLYEDTTIRLRFCTEKPEILEEKINSFVKLNNITPDQSKPFEKYYENKSLFPKTEVLKAFATIMHEISELTIGKLQKQTSFSNYTLTERLSHCIYNNVYGINAEPYFMLKRLGFSLNNNEIEDDPELTILDENIEVVKIESATINSPLNIPVKRK